MPLNPRPIVGARSYAQYRAEREKLHADWLQRKKERDEKLARGEEVGPEEPDPTEEREVGCLGLLKFIFYATLFVVLAGKFFTGSFLWEMELPSVSQFMPVRGRVSLPLSAAGARVGLCAPRTRPVPRGGPRFACADGGSRRLQQSGQRLFSETFLAQFDGTDADRPVYIAVSHVSVAMCRGRACTREAHHECARSRSTGTSTT